MARRPASEYELVVRLMASTAQMQAELNNAHANAVKNTTGMQRAFDKLDRAFDKMNSKGALVGQALAAVGVGAAVVKIAQLTQATLDHADALQDQAEKLGMSTDALQEYRFAGQQMGASIEQVDGILEKFSINIAEAAKGQGDLAKVARQNGIALKDQNGNLRDTGSILADFADVIANTTDQQEKLRLSRVAFGREGGRFVNLLQQGSSALNDLRSQAHNLGAVIDKDLIASTARMADELDALKAGLAATFQAGVMKGIVASSGDAEEALLRLQPVAEELGLALGRALDTAAEAAVVLSENLDLVQGAFYGLMGAKAGSAFGPWGAAIGLVVGALVSLHDDLDTATSSVDQQEGAVRKLAVAMQNAARSGNALADAQLRVAQGEVNKQIAAHEAEIKKIERLSKVQTSGGRKISYNGEMLSAEQAAAAANKHREAIARLNFDLAAGITVTTRRQAATLGAATADRKAAAAIDQTVSDLREQMAALKKGGLTELWKVEDLQAARKAYEDLNDQTGRSVSELAAAHGQQRKLNAEKDAYIDRLKEEQDRLDEAVQNISRQNDAAKDRLRDMNDEVRVLELMAAGQEDLAAWTELELQLQRELGPAYAERSAAYKKAFEDGRRLRKEIEAQEEAAKEAEEAARKAAEEMAAIWDEAARDMFDAWRNGWRDLLSGKVKDFKDFAKTVGNIGLDLAANLLAAQTWNAMFGGSFSAAQGGAGGGGVGGAAGSLGSSAASSWLGQQFGLSSLFSTAGIDAFGAQYLGMSTYGAGVPASFVGPMPAAQTAGATLSGALGAAGLGALGGNVLARLLGLNKTGATIGGGVGAGAGYVLGSMTPLGPIGGAIIGGVVTSILGGLIGGKPSDRAEAASFDFRNGARGQSDLGRGKDSPENRDAAEKAIDGLLQLRDAVEKTTGGVVKMGYAAIQVGGRDGIVAKHGEKEAKFAVGDVQGAFKWLAAEMMATVDGLSANMQKAVATIDFSGDLEEALGLLEFAAALDKFENQKPGEQISAMAQAFADFDAMLPELQEKLPKIGRDIDEAAGIIQKHKDALTGDWFKALQDELLQMTDPQQFELDQLDGWRTAMLKDAELAGRGQAEIEGIYAKRRADIIARYGADAVDTEEATEIAARAAEEAARAALEAAEQAAALASDAFDRVMNAARANVEAQMESLQTEREAIEAGRTFWADVANSAADAARAIKYDATTSSMNNRGRLEGLMSELEAAYAASKDPSATKEQREAAASKIAGLAQEVSRANAAYNTSSKEAARVNQRLQDILGDTQTIASRELQVADLALAANLAQVELLKQQLELMGRVQQPTVGGKPADLDAVIAAYNQAFAKKGDMGMEDWVNSSIFQAFENEAAGIFAAMTDTARLLQELATLEGRSDADPLKASGMRLGATIRGRLGALGVQGFAGGGTASGMAMLHPRELVYTGPPAHVINAGGTMGLMGNGQVPALLRGLRDDVNEQTAMLEIIGSDHTQQLSALNGRMVVLERNGARNRSGG